MRISHLVFTTLAAVSAFAAGARADTRLAAAANWDQGVAVSPPADADPSGWKIFVEESYIVPGGYSVSPVFDFGANPATVDALRAQLFVQPGAICNAGVYAIDIATSPLQQVGTRYFPDADGVVSLPNTLIYKAGVVLYQPTILATRCVLRFSGLAAPDDGGGTDTGYTLIGAVHYLGGFVADLGVDVPNADKISKFKISVPAFCHDAEVLGANTMTEGHLDAAHLIDANENVFEVNGGAGSRISSISLQINGPVGLSCDIPVYVQKAP